MAKRRAPDVPPSCSSAVRRATSIWWRCSIRNGDSPARRRWPAYRRVPARAAPAHPPAQAGPLRLERAQQPRPVAVEPVVQRAEAGALAQGQDGEDLDLALGEAQPLAVEQS